jgi:hypothetical protein
MFYSPFDSCRGTPQKQTGLHAGLRRNDGLLQTVPKEKLKSPTAVMPALAGIHSDVDLSQLLKAWFPAFAGMTDFFRDAPRKWNEF